MSKIIQVTKVEETFLWKTLSNRRGKDAQYLSINVLSLSEEAIDLMKVMYSYAPQYTLHDEMHLLRTTELMGLILGSEIKHLNIIELTLLILSAFFHDQGMILSREELLSLDSNSNFQLFRDNWQIEHPNYRETEAQMISPLCSEPQKVQLSKKLRELDSAILIEYIRETHGARTANTILYSYQNDKRLEIQNINLAPFLAELSQSHTLPCNGLIPRKGFRFDEQIGTYTVNLPFLGVVLRLADILDFDRDRTPEVLFKNIHFTSDVSLFEWEKHRSVQGWRISSDLIQFTIKCKHPAYEAAAHEYMNWIDRELLACKELCRTQPSSICKYKLNLPTHVDRSRIEPENDAYRIHNLEFCLSRDEIVHLLMTDKLYGNENLCIRELLQNSLDALRYRRALSLDAGIKWDKGIVKFRHFVNTDGNEVLECTDNGSGMDDEIIQNHFVKVGRSFYRSPFFERERNRLKSSGNDFDPCSQFGIGFMSCFMLGDRITITTRKDYGYGREWGLPLIVEIHGLSSLIVVRQGPPDQPIGTTVTIVSRQIPSFIDSWTDKVQLCRILKGYALATEFPIIGQCDVPELMETISIPESPELAPTLLESAEVKNHISFHQDLSMVSSYLGGFVRESFLIDDTGLPCLANSEAQWVGQQENSIKKWVLKLLLTGNKINFNSLEWSVPVCIDGILIAGTPGRPSFRKDVELRLGSLNSFIDSRSPALIDARGEYKPEITPGRTPPNHFMERFPRWKRLAFALKQGSGLLWEQLADFLSKGLSPEIFWKLAVIHQFTVTWIPCGKLWEMLSISLVKDDQIGSWHLVRNLGEMSMCRFSDNSFILRNKNGGTVGPDSNLTTWENQGENRPHLQLSMNSAVLVMSCLDIINEEVVLFPSPPKNTKEPFSNFIDSSLFGVSMFLIDYTGNANDSLAVQTPFPTVNRNHPLVEIYQQSRYTNSPTNLQNFVKAFVPCISKSISTLPKSPSFDKPSYWQKRVSHLYFSVQWDQLNVCLRPPYKLWSKEKGWFWFSEEDFVKWRDSKAQIN